MQVKDLVFQEPHIILSHQDLYRCNTNLGVITVMHIHTGFGNNTENFETGYEDIYGKFWLAYDNFDIRNFGDLDLEDAIQLIKDKANACIGVDYEILCER